MKVRSSHGICRIIKTPSLTFAGTAEKVFEHGPPWSRRYSKAAALFVDYTIMATYFGTCCVYIVFMANTFHDLFEEWFGWVNISIRIYILFIMIPIQFLGQVRTLKFLVPFSGAANAFMLVVFGVVLYYIFKEPLVWDDKSLIVSWTTWPMFFS